MNTLRWNVLEVSPRDRLVSRVCFYVLVAAVMWTTNHLLPDWDAIEEAKWESRGVVPPLIAVPLSELNFTPAAVIDVGSVVSSPRTVSTNR